MAKGQESMVIQGACFRPRQATCFRPRQATWLRPRQLGPRQAAAHRVLVTPAAATAAAAAAGAQDTQARGSAGTAALTAMSRQRSPPLRLLSLNVNGLRDKDKRRCLFNILERDK